MERARTSGLLTIALALAVLRVAELAQARAQPSTLTAPALRLEVPERLAPGLHTSLAVFVRLPDGPPQPLLLTPSSEGAALRVLRGRLLRADARALPNGELRFEVPIETRGEGTAVVRIELLTYRCAERCVAVRTQETRTIEVRAR